MKRTSLAILLVIALPALLPKQAFPATERRPTMPVGSETFAGSGRLELYLEYGHEESNVVREGTGEVVDNPDQSEIDFNTLVMAARYGVGSRFNLTATIPYHSIFTEKLQIEPYPRSNKGLGDLLIAAEAALRLDPHLILELGLELPTGNVDKVDGLGQRFTDILALGSETTDIVLGGRFWMARTPTRRLEVAGWLRHRFSGGQNKWGYVFGDETDFGAHVTYPASRRALLGLRLEGYHTEPDTWHDSHVPARGATMLYVGPTAFWSMSSSLRFGGFAQFPLYMNLEGPQIVARAVVGLMLTVDVNSALDRWTRRDGESE
jgi:hypothetical protein